MMPPAGEGRMWMVWSPESANGRVEVTLTDNDPDFGYEEYGTRTLDAARFSAEGPFVRAVEFLAGEILSELKATDNVKTWLNRNWNQT